MIIREMSLIVAMALSSCASVEVAQADQARKEAVSICDLSRSGSLVEGATARIAAVYRTDNSHYSYMANTECGKEGVLNIGNVDPVSEKSVKEFFDSSDRRCAEAGTPYICVLSGKVDADIRIIRDQEGKLAAELVKVHEFSFD